MCLHAKHVFSNQIGWYLSSNCIITEKCVYFDNDPFVFSELRWEVIGYVVVIGGTDDYSLLILSLRIEVVLGGGGGGGGGGSRFMWYACHIRILAF